MEHSLAVPGVRSTLSALDPTTPAALALNIAAVKMDPMESSGTGSHSSYSQGSQDDLLDMKDEGSLQWHLYDNGGHVPEDQRFERSRNLSERKIWTCPVQGCGRRYWYLFTPYVGALSLPSSFVINLSLPSSSLLRPRPRPPALVSKEFITLNIF